jgi:hypothetical protein
VSRLLSNLDTTGSENPYEGLLCTTVCGADGETETQRGYMHDPPEAHIKPQIEQGWGPSPTYPHTPRSLNQPVQPSQDLPWARY